MPRIYPISSIKAGITRLRTKGGADPSSLFDLVNAHVTASNSVEPRAGTDWVELLPAGTKGLTAFEGALHVFASTIIASPDPLFVINVLRHPTSSTATLEKIHFADPIMRGLYVAAEFSDGNIYHYWLQRPPVWEADAAYRPGDIVAPSATTGYIYRASRLTAANVLWAPNVLRALGDKIEPTTSNGFYYEVTDVDGVVPKSGETEPLWPAQDGASIRESSDVPPTTAPVVAPPVPPRGGGGGGGDDFNYCLAEDQLVDFGRQIADIQLGDEVDAHDPIKGMFRARCTFVGDRVQRPCVRLVTESGCSVICSVDTPVNLLGAISDLVDDTWRYAPNLFGHSILDDAGGGKVVSVEPVGVRWVAPRGFGGVSFAGGESAAARVYTHNMAKSAGP